jgi:hypothetical protein
VLRYAGRLDEAESECDKALASDSKNYNWRSCSFAFFEEGKSARAIEYLNVDAGSKWSNAVRVSVLMREGKMSEAQQAAQQMPEDAIWMRGLLEACLNKAPEKEVHRLAEQAENELLSETDSQASELDALAQDSHRGLHLQGGRGNLFQPCYSSQPRSTR